MTEFKMIKLRKKGGIKVVARGHFAFCNHGNKSIPISDELYFKVKPGRYVIRAKVHWPENRDYNNVILSVFS